MNKRISALLEDIRKKVLQPMIRKMGGYDSINEEISTLYYILDHYIDIMNFPKATGLLRQTQLVDVEILRIFDNICRKYNLTYWMDRGTLLGAVRHKGFIPWDDDLDVSMPREDYIKVSEILPKELSSSKIHVVNQKEKRIALSIWEAGANLDIFPMDNVAESTVDSYDELKMRVLKYRKFYVKNRSRLSIEKLTEKKEEIVGKYVSENPIWYHNPEHDADKTVFSNDMIFPLIEITFEGYCFFAPNNTDACLKEKFGDYMSFPRNRILHHHGGSGDPIYHNAIKHHVDMDELYEQLRLFSV